jgi:hypothetical protein
MEQTYPPAPNPFNTAYFSNCNSALWAALVQFDLGLWWPLLDYDQSQYDEDCRRRNNSAAKIYRVSDVPREWGKWTNEQSEQYL